jgi:uncharacterized protein
MEFATSRRRFLLGGAVAAGCLAIGDRLSAQGAGHVRSLLEIRRENVVVQEWDLSCGAAALATILRYQHGDDVSERALVEGLIRRDIYIENPELVRVREGFSLLDLKRVVEQRGYNGFGYGDLTFADLMDLAPIITPIDPKGYNHFVIMIGRIGDDVQLADPAFGNTTMAVERFQRVWMDFPDFGHVGFIVTRGDEAAPPGRLRPNPRVFMIPPLGQIRAALF